MKTILKVLGIAAGIYGAMGFGAFVGIAGYDEYCNGRFNKNIEMEKKAIDAIEANIDIWRNIRRDIGKDNSLKNIKRSDVLRRHARKWAEEGFSPEEIKQGLDLLRKELD